MKKAFLSLLFCAAAATPMSAQYAATATDKIYDFSGFNDENLLELFYQAELQGRHFPTQAEFEAKGIQASDLAFVRSHVRRAAIMDTSADPLVTTLLNKKRNLWMNMPMDEGSDGLGGYPKSKFHVDVFSMWQYVNLFGTWNHGIFQAPGAWVDAAHRNGSDIMSGIKFFDTTGGAGLTANSYLNILLKTDAAGNYKYVAPLLDILMYMGSDGINYNWEASGYSDSKVLAFHRQLYKLAKERGFNEFHAGLYTSSQGFSGANMATLYGSNATGQTWDFMGNYSGGDFAVGNAAASITAAKQGNFPLDDAYQGVWLAHMNKNWTGMDSTATADIGICIWGEHGRSRFFQYTTGKDCYDTQKNYQYMLEAAFSGGKRNPANRPTLANTGNNFGFTFDSNMNVTEYPLTTFGGFATLIPERTAIQGNFQFQTLFNLGNGAKYVYKGVPTANQWYNMSAQDIVPTYRWLVYNANTTTVATNIQPEFYQRDAYIGGSCLKLAGTASSTGTDIILYKTALTVGKGNPMAKVAVKTYKEGINDTGLTLILRGKGMNSWIEVPIGNTSSANWEEKVLALNLPVGTVIDRIGFRVKGNGAYNVSVGRLALYDDTQAVPAAVKDVKVEVKEETQASMSFKIYWDVNATQGARAQYGMIGNDEANIHHFEILYKNGANGKPKEIGRTSQWATYIGNYELAPGEDPYIGVRPASTDLKTYGDVQWVHVTRAAASLLPEKNATSDSYGISELDPAAEGTANARQQRYLTNVSTTGAVQNLNYTASAPVPDGSQYTHPEGHKLIVRQGQKITLYTKGESKFSDGLKYCVTSAWLDLDGSGDFNGAPLATDAYGEMLYRYGEGFQANPVIESGLSKEFTIPQDAATGASRLRIVYADAWFAGTLAPSGNTAKGFSIDFDVEIIGDNPSRAPMSQTTFQYNDVELPEGIVINEISTVEKKQEGVSRAQLVGRELRFANVEKAWIYTADGKFVKFASSNPASVDLSGFTPGTYLVKMEYQNLLRSQKFVVR